MCGRFVQSSLRIEIVARFGCEASGAPEIPANYNLSPTQDAAVVRFNSADGKRHLGLLRWGLVPSWSKDYSVGAKLTNARAESLTDKPSFRAAALKRRCLIPVDAFYEWRRTEKVKQPYAFTAQDNGSFAVAGLWEGWRGPDGKILRSFAVVTTSANEVMSPIHDRMPVIVSPADWSVWLGEQEGDWQSLLRPCPSEWLKCWPVSRRVNSGRENEANLLDQIIAAESPATKPQSLPLGL